MRVPPYRLCPLIYFRSYNIGRRRASSGTHLPPPRAQRSEIFSRMCSTPLPRKAKSTMSCRAPVVRLVTVPARAWTQQLFRERNPPDSPPRAPVVCSVTVPVPCLDTKAAPPSSTPLGAGSQILSRAWTQQTCRGGTSPPRARSLVLGHIFIYLFLTFP